MVCGAPAPNSGTQQHYSHTRVSIVLITVWLILAGLARSSAAQAADQLGLAMVYGIVSALLDVSVVLRLTGRRKTAWAYLYVEGQSARGHCKMHSCELQVQNLCSVVADTKSAHMGLSRLHG